MPITTRPRPTTSDSRTKLAEAHAALAAAQAAVQAAEVAHDEAKSEYFRAKDVVDGIEDRMNSIAKQWKEVHPLGRDGLQVKYDECQTPLKEAKLPLMALGVAAEAAEAKVTEARQRVSFYHSRMHDAAAAVVRDEVPAIAKPMIEQLEKAVSVILALGPDVYYLLHNSLLPKDAIPADISRLLNVSTTQWPAFEQRYRASPWRGAVAALEQDQEASLPMAPAA